MFQISSQAIRNLHLVPVNVHPTADANSKHCHFLRANPSLPQLHTWPDSRALLPSGLPLIHAMGPSWKEWLFIYRKHPDRAFWPTHTLFFFLALTFKIEHSGFCNRSDADLKDESSGQQENTNEHQQCKTSKPDWQAMTSSYCLSCSPRY